MALFFFFLSLYLPVASLKKIVSCDISICLCINSLPALLNPILSLSSLTRSRVFCLSRSITGRRTRLDVIWPWWTRRRKNRHRQESSTSQAESINTSRTFRRSMTYEKGRTRRDSSNSLKQIKNLLCYLYRRVYIKYNYKYNVINKNISITRCRSVALHSWQFVEELQLYHLINFFFYEIQIYHNSKTSVGFLNPHII